MITKLQDINFKFNVGDRVTKVITSFFNGQKQYTTDKGIIIRIDISLDDRGFDIYYVIKWDDQLAYTKEIAYHLNKER